MPGFELSTGARTHGPTDPRPLILDPGDRLERAVSLAEGLLVETNRVELQSQLFGRYRLLEVIGAGGMAEVFLAKLEGIEGFERRLAIKRILPSFSRNDSFVQMFIDEARLVGHFNHPNIVQIYDFGKIEGSYYISMEFVEGINIADILTRYKAANMHVPLEVLLEIGIQACRGIDYAHRETDEMGRPLGIIHRDLTPHNILISKKGVVKITDFGIAKASMNTHMTQAGMIKGKVPYMSPEQAMGLPLTHVSDIFSIGIVMYEMCTLRRLFEGENDFTILRKVQEAKVPSIVEQNPNVPSELETIIRRALARDRTERYQWASEMEADLTRLKFSLAGKLQNFTLAEFIQRFIATQPPPVRKPVGGTGPSPAQVVQQVLAQGAAQPVGAQGANGQAGPSGAAHAPGPDAHVASAIPNLDESLSALAAGLSRVNNDPLSLLRQMGEEADKKTVMMSIGTGPDDPNWMGMEAPNSGTKPPPSGGHTAPDANAADDPSIRDTVKNAKAKVKVEGPTPFRGSRPGTQNRALLFGIAAVLTVLVAIGTWLAVPRTATLALEITPGEAEIFLNGEKVGTGSSFVREDIPGGNTITVKVQKEGFKDFVVTRTVEAGIRYRVPVKLEAIQRFGALLLETVPAGAKVEAEGKTVGVTPLKINVPAEKPYAVTVSLEGYQPKTETVTVKSTEERSVSLTLEPVAAAPALPVDGSATAPATPAPPPK